MRCPIEPAPSDTSSSPAPMATKDLVVLAMRIVSATVLSLSASISSSTHDGSSRCASRRKRVQLGYNQIHRIVGPQGRRGAFSRHMVCCPNDSR
jgi:hypothetical protein